MQKNLKPQLVREAYLRIGFRPIQCTFVNLNTRCCCGLTAMAIDSGLVTPERLIEISEANHGMSFGVRYEICETLNISPTEAVAFMTGFDGGSANIDETTGRVASKSLEEWRLLGRDCWDAVEDLRRDVDK